jgi:hypothetical protein
MHYAKALKTSFSNCRSSGLERASPCASVDTGHLYSLRMEESFQFAPLSIDLQNVQVLSQG